MRTTESDDEMRPIAAKGRVKVATKDVVEAQLLKQAIEVENFDSDPDALLDASVTRQRDLVKRSKKEGATVRPKALYVVEKSNPRKGEVVSRPVAIWEHLREKKVPPDEIAVYTQTKVLPEDAESVSALSDLAERHRHIICNRALQEGWDDPEAYVEYFDDESNSYVRIAQIIGRALRQPGAQHFTDEALNTAYLYVRVPGKAFDSIVAGLKKELALYATDEDDPYGSAAIKIKTKKEPLPEVPVKRGLAKKLTLPNYQLGEADLNGEIKKIKSQSKKLWDDDELVAKGLRTMKRISLAGDNDKTRYKSIAIATRRPCGQYLQRRIKAGNRHCANLLEPEIFSGPAYEQRASGRSLAQQMLAERAAAVIDQFERSVQLIPNTISGEKTWTVPPHQPGNSDMITYKNAAHTRYSSAGFNPDEREFADVIDSLKVGTWTRNPARGSGYGIELPVKVGGSSTFYPDFLWWIGNTCYAIDPTGAHILNEKARGKLLTIDKPKIVLLTRGRVAKEFNAVESEEGWSMVRPLAGRAPSPEFFDTIREALIRLTKEAGRKVAGAKKAA